MNKRTCVILSLALLASFAGCTRKHTSFPPPQEIVFPKTGHWEIEGRDTKIWTGSLVILQVDGEEFTGYFDWRYSPSGEYVGREEFSGVYDPQSKKVTIQGNLVTDPNRLAPGTYVAVLAENGSDFASGVWGGGGTPPDFGSWTAKFKDQNIEGLAAADSKRVKAGVYLLRASESYEAEEYDKAIENATAEIMLNANEDFVWRAYALRAMSHIEIGNHERAVKDFSIAIRMGIANNEDIAMLYNARAWTYAHHMKKEFDRAIEDVDRAIELDPEEAAYYDTRGWAYFGKGDYDKAEADFSKALQLEPDLEESKDGLEKVREARAAAPAK